MLAPPLCRTYERYAAIFSLLLPIKTAMLLQRCAMPRLITIFHYLPRHFHIIDSISYYADAITPPCRLPDTPLRHAEDNIVRDNGRERKPPAGSTNNAKQHSVCGVCGNHPQFMPFRHACRSAAISYLYYYHAISTIIINTPHYRRHLRHLAITITLLRQPPITPISDI